MIRQCVGGGELCVGDAGRWVARRCLSVLRAVILEECQVIEKMCESVTNIC